MKTISQRELRNDSGAIMRRVELGERFIVTRNGTPVADLVPHDEAGSTLRPHFVAVAHIGVGLSALPPWNGDRFSDDQQSLDEIVDDRETDPWSHTGG